jgi:hypothetical protein
MISAVFQDVKEEASKYGQVVSVVIPRPNIKKKVPSLSLSALFLCIFISFFADARKGEAEASHHQL